MHSFKNKQTLKFDSFTQRNIRDVQKHALAYLQNRIELSTAKSDMIHISFA